MAPSTQIWPETWPPGWHVRHVSETGSTNTDLLDAAVQGAPHRSVLAADHQTAGRGRLDRRWEAPPGANLLVSLLFRDVPRHPVELVSRTSLAAVRAIERRTGVVAHLKWPNDLVVGDRKLAGVLSQRAADGSIVVGLGLNVGWAPEGAVDLGAAVSPGELLFDLLEEYDRLPDDISTAYRERLGTLGRRVRVEVPDGTLIGRAVDVEPDGRLVVLDECGVTHRLDVGDIVHLRGASGDA